MDYGFKPTTNGRRVLAACLAQEKTPEITRVLFGSGRVAEDVNLADVHELLQYVAEGTIGDRRHLDDHFHFTIQYANVTHPGVPTFYLSEFMVLIRDPETGEETDLLYGTLGDYRFAVPEYHSTTPPSVFNLPLVLVISDEVEVKVSAVPGLVTFGELHDAVRNAVEEAVAESGYRGAECVISTIAMPADGWKLDGACEDGYPWYLDIQSARARAGMAVSVDLNRESMAICRASGTVLVPESADGYVRVWANNKPGNRLTATLTLLGESVGSSAAIITDVVLPLGDWTALEDSEKIGDGMEWKLDIAIAEVRDSMTPRLDPHKGSIETVRRAGMSTAPETMEGRVRIWSASKPEADIAATLVLLTRNGAGIKTDGIASAETPGRVMVKEGSGLRVDDFGNLSLDLAGRADIEKIFSE